MNEAKVGASYAASVAQNKAKRRAQGGYKQALQHEDASHLRCRNSEAHHDGDVASLLHDHHGESNQNIERGDHNDQCEDDEGDDLLQLEGAEELAVLLHPVGRLKAGARGRFDFVANLLGAVEVVDAEAEDADEIGFGEESLRVGEAHEGVGGIVLVKPGGEDADDSETLVAREKTEGGKVALGAGDEDRVGESGTEVEGEFSAYDDGRNGGWRKVCLCIVDIVDTIDAGERGW